MKDLTTFTLSVIKELEDEGRFGTAHVYRSMLRAFMRYWKNRYPEEEIRMKKAFAVTTVQGFEKHLQERMLKLNTSSTYLRMLRAVYNRALLAGLTGYVPGLFAHVYTGTRADVKRALPPADMGRALAVSPTLQHGLKEAQTWVALLFLLRGMPFADLARLRKCDFRNGAITYRRQKTGRQVHVQVTAETAELLRQCADRHTASPYLLDILWDEKRRFPMGSHEEYRHYQRILRNFNRRLKLLATTLGLSGKLSSYTARHTWATTAFHQKIAVGIISNALGHSSVKVTETYLKPFENEMLDKANRRIIAYVKRCTAR